MGNVGNRKKDYLGKKEQIECSKEGTGRARSREKMEFEPVRWLHEQCRVWGRVHDGPDAKERGATRKHGLTEGAVKE